MDFSLYQAYLVLRMVDFLAVAGIFPFARTHGFFKLGIALHLAVFMTTQLLYTLCLSLHPEKPAQPNREGFLRFGLDFVPNLIRKTSQLALSVFAWALSLIGLPAQHLVDPAVLTFAFVSFRKLISFACAVYITKEDDPYGHISSVLGFLCINVVHYRLTMKDTTQRASLREGLRWFFVADPNPKAELSHNHARRRIVFGATIVVSVLFACQLLDLDNDHWWSHIDLMNILVWLDMEFMRTQAVEMRGLDLRVVNNPEEHMYPV